MVSRPGLLAHARLAGSVGAALGKIVVTPWLHILQRGDGRVVIGETAERGGASSGAYAAGGGRSDAERREGEGGGGTGEDEMEGFGKRMIERAGRLAPGLMRGAKLELVSVGWRPMPRDGLPVIGFLKVGNASTPYLRDSLLVLGALPQQDPRPQKLDPLDTLPSRLNTIFAGLLCDEAAPALCLRHAQRRDTRAARRRPRRARDRRFDSKTA